jgi:hypothetical protein
MSAVVVSTRTEWNPLTHLSNFNAVRNRQKPFHFREAAHDERIAFMDALRWSGFSVITVITHKPSISEDAAIRNESHLLFRFTSKLLIERISWLCDENRMPGASPVARLVFSERGSLTTDRVTRHLARLRAKTGRTRIERGHDIRWNVIDPAWVEVASHASMPALHVADAAASSVEKAIEYSRYGTTEHRYVKIWRDQYYRRYGRCMSYGIKVYPNLPFSDPFEADRFHWMRHFK